LSTQEVPVTSIGSAPAKSAADPPTHAGFGALWRARALLFRGRLDAELAAGTDSESDPALARRARRLTCPRYRRRLAVSVERLVEETHADPGSFLTSAVPIRREQVAQASGTLLSLAGALRDVDPVDARGVALTLRLITDPTSPLYSGTAGALQDAAREALDRLLARSQPWCDLPEAPPLPDRARS
jgi:hypothetical protein